MGPKKKRNLHSHSRLPYSAKNATTSDTAPPNNTTSSDNHRQEQSNTKEPEENPAIEDECERALAAIQRGNRNKALKLIKAACVHYENSGLVHHTHATIHCTIACHVDDKTEYLQHLKNALESAKKAISLSPNSILIADTYATLLFRLATSVKDYQEVVKECERALDMLNNSLSVEEISEEGHKYANRNLRWVLEQTKIKLAEIGTKELGIGDEKSRKENEVRVTDDMLLQQEPRRVQSQSVEDIAFKLAESKKMIRRLEERKRQTNLKKYESKIGEVKELWNSRSVEEKCELALLSPKALKEYCSKFKGVLGEKELVKAIAYFTESGTWKYWDCCVCGNIFRDMDLFIDHISKKHLKVESTYSNAFLPEVFHGDGSATSFAASDHAVHFLSKDSDAFVDGLFAGPTVEEALRSWQHLKYDHGHLAMESYLIVQKAYADLENLLMRRSELLIHKKTFQTFQKIFTGELEKRDQVSGNVSPNYEFFLRRWQEELVDISITESCVIEKVLEEIQAATVNEGDAHERNKCISTLIQRRLEESSSKISKIDARIVQSSDGAQHRQRELAEVSVHDYSLIIAPLLRSFQRVNLEDLVYRNAILKSDAAREALLAEVESDASKNLIKGNNRMKHTEGKFKDKKKKKIKGKAKNSKASAHKLQDMLNEKDAQQSHIPVPSNGDRADSPIGVSASSSELKLQEEERRHKIEFESEERMLQENFERQIKIENEAKQRWLAEQNKNSDGTKSEVVEPLSSLTGLPQDLSGIPVNKLEGAKESSPIFGKRTEGEKNFYHGEVKQDALKEQKELEVLSTDVEVKNIEGSDVFFGTRMRNDLCKINCFFDATIQSIWHLRRFRDEFFTLAGHVHVGDPCVVCALHQIFKSLSNANSDRQREAVDPTSLRTALSIFCPGNNFLQEEQEGGAFEVFEKILCCLHESFIRVLDVSEAKSETECTGPSRCTSKTCMAHTYFGLDILARINCDKCGFQYGCQKESSCFLKIVASELRETKNMHADKHFQEILKLLAVDDTFLWHCGKVNCINRFLSTPPRVLTVIIVWKSESADAILATLTALSTEINLGLLYQGLDRGNRYWLVSMVCYCRHQQHYYCLAYIHEQDNWIMIEDKTIVKVIGSWDNLLSTCKNDHLQPHILFFEDVKGDFEAISLKLHHKWKSICNPRYY